MDMNKSNNLISIKKIKIKTQTNFSVRIVISYLRIKEDCLVTKYFVNQIIISTAQKPNNKKGQNMKIKSKKILKINKIVATVTLQENANRIQTST